MAMKNEVNLRAIVTIGTIGVLLLVVVLLAADAFYHSAQEEEDLAKAANAPYMPLASRNLEQLGKISEYRWVDQNKQIVAIPVDQAMHIMVETKGSFPTTQPKP